MSASNLLMNLGKRRIIRRLTNVVLLGLSWMLAISGLFINISMTTSAATRFYGQQVSTVPAGLFLMSAAVGLGISYFAVPRFGRRAVYLAVGFSGALGSALMIVAAMQEIFGLLLVGTIFQGPSMGVALSFRFTSPGFFPAPEFSQQWRTRSISLTVGCAVFSAAIGSEAALKVQDNIGKPFTGGYTLLVGLYLAQALLSGIVDFKWLEQIEREQLAERRQIEEQKRVELQLHKHSVSESYQEQQLQAQQQQRGGLQRQQLQQVNPPVQEACSNVQVQSNLLPSPTIVAQDNSCSSVVGYLTKSSGMEHVGAAKDHKLSFFWALMKVSYLVPALSGATAFFTMAAIMTATPGAMELKGFSSKLATYTLEAHIGAMYLPSLVVSDMVDLVRFIITTTMKSRWMVVRFLACMIFLVLPQRSEQQLPLQQPDLMAQARMPEQPKQHEWQRQIPQQQQQHHHHHHHHQIPQQQQQLQHQTLQQQQLHPYQQTPKQLACNSIGTLRDLDTILGTHDHAVTIPRSQETVKPAPPSPRPTTIAHNAPVTFIMLLGSAILAASPGLLLASTTLDVFMGGMVLCGVGWSLNYVTASALVSAFEDPELRRTAQTTMDVFLLSLVAGGDATAGLIVRLWGWRPFLILYLAINLGLFLLNLVFHVYTVVYYRRTVPSSHLCTAKKVSGQ